MSVTLRIFTVRVVVLIVFPDSYFARFWALFNLVRPKFGTPKCKKKLALANLVRVTDVVRFTSTCSNQQRKLTKFLHRIDLVLFVQQDLLSFGDDLSLSCIDAKFVPHNENHIKD